MFVHQKNEQVLVVNTSNKKVCVYCNDDIVNYTHHDADGQWMLYCVSSTGNIFRISEQQIVQRSSDTSGDNEGGMEIFEDLLRTEEEHNIDLKLSTELVTVLNDSDIFIKSHDETSQTTGVWAGEDILILYKSSNILEVYTNIHNSVLSKPIAISLPNNKQCHQGPEIVQGSTLVVKILTCDRERREAHYSESDVIRISPQLFKGLFGSETMLLSSSVVLVCPCDGSMSAIYMPLPTSVASQKCVHNGLEKSERDSDSRWQTLCQLSSRIVEITAVKIDVDSQVTVNSALCICSQDGHVTMFHLGSSTTECVASEVYTCSPVLTICSFNNRLYHSTGNQLFESTCVLEQDKTDHQTCDRLTVKTKSLNETNITQLGLSPIGGYTQSVDSPCKLYCVLRNGEVKAIKVPFEETAKSCSHVYRQDNIRHVLKSMDIISHKKEELTKLSTVQKQLIHQLSIASFLINFYVTSNSNNIINNSGRTSDVSPFKLNFVITRDTNLSEKHFLVECDLTNQMPVNLSHDWLLSICMCPTNGNGECTTVSRKLKSDWKPSQKLRLTLPITLRQCLTGCKLVMKAIFHADSLARHLLKLRNQEGTKSSYHDNCSSRKFEAPCISIPVLEQEVDIIDCLIPDAKYTEQVCDSQPSEQHHHLTSLAKNCNNSLDIGSNVGSVTTVCTRSLIRLPGTTDIQKQEMLCNLLSSEIVEKMESCHLRTLDGQTVHLTITRGGNQTTDSSDVKRSKHSTGCYGDWEVTVRSTLELTSAIHKELKRREQKLWQHSGMTEEKVHVSDALKTLASVKDLLRKLQSYESGPSLDVHKHFSAAYEKLRNLQL